MDERTAELGRLRAEIAAHLAWERELGGPGLPAGIISILGQIAPPIELLTGVPRPREVAPGVVAGRAADALGERGARLAQLETEVRACTRCPLHAGRTQTVFARGNPGAALVFVGEGPGEQEDRTGAPFVGPAGQLLDRMIAAMGLAECDVYICNVVKCRPPNNRTPAAHEAEACEPFLTGQLQAVAPRVIVALGRCAADHMGLVPTAGPWRGRWGSYGGVDVMPTYHPAFLLRSPEYKRPVWEDLQQVQARLSAG